MPTQLEKHLYEYAVIRFMPRVEREEFVNIGLLMMCKRRRWIKVAIELNESKIRALGVDVDCKNLSEQLKSFRKVAEGTNSYAQQMEVHERFRWLTAVRSACITTSRPHPGLTDDLEATFERLFAELVL